MKRFKFFLCLLFLILLSTTSCQTSEPVRNNPEYASGKQLADVYAKKDAMKLTCSFYRRGKWSGVMSSNLRKHLEALRPEKSEDFQSGFSEGYQAYYPEYADTYCGK
ncbi:MAG: hypothetical protein JRI91_11730 [Deltaproteobacteria bacterium]|nr:hypothetical protein [Deltaproteobacteria bacterium]